ncbi:MAG: hypothetical protein WD847_06945 [Pirellulales bacterium]
MNDDAASRGGLRGALTRPRRFQFSLKFLLFAVTVLSVLLGARLHRSGMEKRWLEGLRKGRATARYDMQKLNRPGWIHLWLGDKHVNAIQAL